MRTTMCVRVRYPAHLSAEEVQLAVALDHPQATLATLNFCPPDNPFHVPGWSGHVSWTVDQ